MAVVFESEAGWLLDELKLINKWYQPAVGPALTHLTGSQDEEIRAGYRLKKELFMVTKPYYSVQPALVAKEFAAPASKHSAPSGSRSVKQKRKRPHTLNQGEVDALEYHQKVCDFILKESQVLIQEGIREGLLLPTTLKENGDHKSASEVCLRSCNLAELCNMTKDISSLDVHEYSVNVIDGEQPSSQNCDFLSHITENSSNWSQLIHLLGEKYIIPPKTSFLLSDISFLEPLLHYKKYDVIVIDPPWENKSVKRSKRYNHLSLMAIKQLPIPDMAAQNCLVVTWVTNRQKHLRFVKEELYPHWSVKFLAEWHWVKITQSGEFVFPLESTHKKPYEILVLGQLIHANESESEPNPELLPIPQNKIIVSVPCNLHSHKPPLSEVLKKYVKPDMECLELFARNLQPGWTSWGNEVLKFQHVDYFIPIESET